MSWGGLGGFSGVPGLPGGHVGAILAPRLIFVDFGRPPGPQNGANLGPSWGYVGAKLAPFGIIFVFFVVSKLNFNL